MPFDADSDRDALVEETAFSTWTAVSRTTTPRVCWTYREVAPGIYESRSFDPEGRPFAQQDKCTKRMRIVPLMDFRDMLTAHAEPFTLQGSACHQLVYSHRLEPQSCKDATCTFQGNIAKELQ